MNLVQFSEMLVSSGFPVAHHSFTKKQSLPYVIYLTPSQDNFGADNKVYHKVQNIYVELYSEKKDTTSEGVLEDIFDENDLFYEKSETHIESEKMYMVVYEIQI